MFRNLKVGKRAAVRLSLVVLLLAGGGAAGCASGGRGASEVTAEDARQFVETLKETLENVMQVVQSYRS